MSWQQKAACIGADPSLFDEISHTDIYQGGGLNMDAIVRVKQAQTFCRRCPVRMACLKDGQEQKDSGIRGGRLLQIGRVRLVPDEPGKRPRPNQELAA